MTQDIVPVQLFYYCISGFWNKRKLPHGAVRQIGGGSRRILWFTCRLEPSGLAPVIKILYQEIPCDS